jgi:hypothetical protein
MEAKSNTPVTEGKTDYFESNPVLKAIALAGPPKPLLMASLPHPGPVVLPNPRPEIKAAFYVPSDIKFDHIPDLFGARRILKF